MRNFQVVGQNEVPNEFIMATKTCMKTVPDDDNDDIIFTTLILTSLTSWTQVGDQKTIPYNSHTKMDVAPRFVHYLASCRVPIGRKK